MEEWQESLVKERDELAEKIQKLGDFLFSEKIDTLKQRDQELLEQQWRLMRSYKETLDERIQRSVKDAPYDPSQLNLGNWSPRGSSVISDEKIGAHNSDEDFAYYGGYLICESVACEAQARLIASAPKMFKLIKSALYRVAAEDYEPAKKIIAYIEGTE